MDQRRGDELMARAEVMEKRFVPPKVRFLVAAVDVQAGKQRRFVVQIVGYGQHGERWVIDRYNIRSSLRSNSDGEALPVDPGGYIEDWDLLLTDVLNKEYRLTSDPACTMPVMCMAVDSGGEDGVTDNAYKFWRQCRKDGLGKRVYLFKGDSLARKKLVTRSFPDNTTRSDRKAGARGDVPLYFLQTDQLKDRIHNALRRDEPGPNFIHFPDWLGEWFYDELTYEERGLDGKWKKPGRGANEALDLMCYCHALVILRGYERIKDWGNPPAWAKSQALNKTVNVNPPAPDKPTRSVADKPATPPPAAPKPVKKVKTF
jgi:phage terminase large subunit GpA-like protein